MMIISPINFHNANIPSMKANKTEHKGISFINSGGKLYFDKAYDKFNNPYNGSLFSECDTLKIESIYENGDKKEVKLYIKSEANEHRQKATAILTKQQEETGKDGIKTVLYTTDKNRYKYTETYSPSGKLIKSEYIKFKVKREETQDENYPENRINFTYTPFNEPQTTINTGFQNDGVTPYASIIDSDSEMYGFKQKASIFNSNGTPVREEKINQYTIYRNFTSERERTDYKGQDVARITNKNCKYYSFQNAQSPYAVSDRVKSEFINGSRRTEEYGYRILKNEAYSTIRTTAMTMPEKSTRISNGKEVSYFVDNTTDKYAAEILDERKRPIQITDRKNKTISLIRYKNQIAILSKYDKDGNLIQTSVFGEMTNGYMPNHTEKYYPGTNICSKVISYDKKGIDKVTYYSRDNKKVKRIKYNNNGEKEAEAYFRDNSMYKQIINLPNGMQKIIVFEPDNKSIEYTYTKDGKLSSETVFINQRADKQIIYSPDGEVKERISFNNGYKM